MSNLLIILSGEYNMQCVMYILATVFMHVLQYCKAAVHSMIGSQSADWTWPYSKAVGVGVAATGPILWSLILGTLARFSCTFWILAKIEQEMVSKGVKFKNFHTRVIRICTYFNYAYIIQTLSTGPTEDCFVWACTLPTKAAVIGAGDKVLSKILNLGGGDGWCGSYRHSP